MRDAQQPWDQLMSEVCKPSQLEPPTKSTVRQPSNNRPLNKLKESQDDWDFKNLPSAFLAYMTSIHDSSGEMPNKLMLGREIEVSLDVVTKPTLDAVLSLTKYELALQPTS